MCKRQMNLLILALSATVVVAPMMAHHGSNVLMGGFMGAGMGAMVGGHDGVVPGLMTGLAVGTMAEVMDHDQDHYHCHEVVYTHEVRPSRDWLEEQIEILEHKLHKAHQHAEQLEHELEKKDFEIHRLQKRVKQLEQGCHHSSGTTEIIFSTKAISA